MATDGGPSDPLGEGSVVFPLGGEPDLRQWVEAEIAKVESNDLYQQPAALIQINAPVALMQVELKARKQTLEEVLKQL